MGYTHYYQVKDWDSPVWQAIWPQLIQDALLIIEASDVFLTGPAKSTDIITSPITSVDEGILFNGVGIYGHDTFHFCREDQNQRQFMKTEEKPYDLPVACILLRASILCPQGIKVRSDGKWDGLLWKAIRNLHETLWPEDCLQCPWQNYDEDDFWENQQPRESIGLLAQRSTTKSGATRINEKEQQSTQQDPSKTREDSKSFFASRAGYMITAAQLKPIIGWLRDCEERPDHNRCIANPLRWHNLHGICFRLIDIHKRSIVVAPEGCSFAILTYVWGGVEQPRLEQANFDEYSRDYGLESIWWKIPTTIRDAIIVCEIVGERYLWVDALCIVQDSPRDVKIQILRMREIYSAAKFTIAAVSADNAGEGLKAATIAKISTTCDSADELDDVLLRSLWGSRGWCYQEKVLSHRAVLFTSAGVFLQCQETTIKLDGTHLADSKANTALHRSQRVGGLLSIPPGEELETFLCAAEQYSKRAFTKGEDKISAFQGVLQKFNASLDGEESTFIYGLPACAFDQAICWQTADHRPQVRNSNFPSWSWLGWDSSVTFDRSILRTAHTRQMIGAERREIVVVGRNIEVQYPSHRYRKPAALSLVPHAKDGIFGFPSSEISGFFNRPSLDLVASITDLRISSTPRKTEDSNGLYAVYPAICNKLPLSPLPPYGIYTGDIPLRHGGQTLRTYDVEDHENHGACDAKDPIGFIWLDCAWRDSRPKAVYMEFMALNGHPSAEASNGWYITMLMCLLKPDPCKYYSYERLQVMDCCITEATWMRIGAVTKLPSIA
ncbi:hypothetical protein CSPX01_15553 [Colletotrichum filicis]|nr:hypothetical protein CSPX01_15553 [Colletotrichum filicis]